MNKQINKWVNLHSTFQLFKITYSNHRRARVWLERKNHNEWTRIKDLYKNWTLHNCECWLSSLRKAIASISEEKAAASSADNWEGKWTWSGWNRDKLGPMRTDWNARLPATSISQFSSATQSCPTLCDPMNHSTPGLPVQHQLPEFTQTHAHQVSDAIQPSHPLSSPSPPAPNPSQHQGLFQWVNTS